MINTTRYWFLMNKNTLDEWDIYNDVKYRTLEEAKNAKDAYEGFGSGPMRIMYQSVPEMVHLGYDD